MTNDEFWQNAYILCFAVFSIFDITAAARLHSTYDTKQINENKTMDALA